MRYESFGKVANEDGSPTQTTIDMLAGTGRDPEAFARESSGILAGHIADGRGHTTAMTCCDPAQAAYDKVLSDQYGEDREDWPTGLGSREENDLLVDTIMRATAAYDAVSLGYAPLADLDDLVEDALSDLEGDALTRQALMYEDEAGS